MKIAMPLFEGKLSAHFGHCTEFALVSVDEEEKQVGEVQSLQPPTHALCELQGWYCCQSQHKYGAENKDNQYL